MKEPSRGLLKTLKIISHKATRFLPFLIIIIMVINVYKLETLRQKERTAEAKIQRGTGGHITTELLTCNDKTTTELLT